VLFCGYAYSIADDRKLSSNGSTSEDAGFTDLAPNHYAHRHDVDHHTALHRTGPGHVGSINSTLAQANHTCASTKLKIAVLAPMPSARSGGCSALRGRLGADFTSVRHGFH